MWVAYTARTVHGISICYTMLASAAQHPSRLGAVMQPCNVAHPPNRPIPCEHCVSLCTSDRPREHTAPFGCPKSKEPLISFVKNIPAPMVWRHQKTTSTKSSVLHSGPYM
jgi:hypothetical protein